MTKFSTSNRRERRAQTKQFALFKKAYLAATIRVEGLLDAIRIAAVSEPEDKYRKPILMFARNALAFGEAEKVATAYLTAVQGDVREMKAFDLSSTLGDKTMAEIGNLFFHKKEEMTEALTVVATGLTMTEMGLGDDDVNEKVKNHLAKVFKLLGVKEKS